MCVCGICTYILYHCSIHMCVLATLCIIYICVCVCKQLVVCSSDPYVCRLQQKKTTVLVHIMGLSENKVLKLYGFSSSPHFKVLILGYFGCTQFQDQLVSLLIRPNSQLTYRTSACLVKVAAPAKITSSKSRRGWLKDPNIPGESHPIMTVFCD